VLGKNDFSTVSESARFLIRKRAILLLQPGKKQYEVAEIIGVKKKTICVWYILFKKGGFVALKGKTPVKKNMSKRFSVKMISTVTNQGKVQFMIYSTNMNSQKLIELMEQLIKGSEKKIFLILDNLRVHHRNTEYAFNLVEP